ncbi:MAG: hypothetical protein CM15mP29_1490 [Alphaproteobacteria bacterium]|nr:MAG: hypothetical protein CM15mP29_1490 [Alphaproteobacteria bacterium]
MHLRPPGFNPNVGITFFCLIKYFFPGLLFFFQTLQLVQNFPQKQIFASYINLFVNEKFLLLFGPGATFFFCLLLLTLLHHFFFGERVFRFHFFFPEASPNSFSIKEPLKYDIENLVGQELFPLKNNECSLNCVPPGIMQLLSLPFVKRLLTLS